MTGHTAAQARQFHQKAVHKLGMGVIRKVHWKQQPNTTPEAS
jgi:hypothetical protein